LKKKLVTKDSSLSRQLTLDNQKFSRTISPKATLAANDSRQIILIKTESSQSKNELVIKVAFALSPSKSVFPSIRCNLFFDGQQIKTNLVTIPQNQVATNDFELTPIVLDMKGLNAGFHTFRVDLSELLPLKNKVSSSKEFTIEYVSALKAEKYVKLPVVKTFEIEALEVNA
jgi:hypothetical protein